MRFRVDIGASAGELAWADVHGPARGVLYGLLKSQNLDLAIQLHDHGWANHPLKPLGVSPPLFAGTKSRRAVYTTSQNGNLFMGSPIPGIAGCLLAALAGLRELRWGRVTLPIQGVQLDAQSDYSSGFAVFESVSPVLVKRENRYLMPDEAGFEEGLAHNLAHKADVLGLPNAVQVEVLAAGPRRRFDVQKAIRIGGTASVRVVAAPRLLDALCDWGLGLCTNQGFGWVR